MKKIAVILLAILMLFTLFNRASGDNSVNGDSQPIWAMFGYNAQHIGQCIYDTSKNEGKQRWSFKTGKWVYASPVIGSDGTIYIGSYDNYFYAINANGTLKWKYQVSDAIRGSAAICIDGSTIVGDTGGNIYSFKPDGSLKWNIKLDNAIYSSPTIGLDGTIYIGTGGTTVENYLYAINCDGILKWKIKIGSISSSPAVSQNGTIYVGTVNAGPSLYAINPDGTMRWSYYFGTITISSPSISSDGTIYVGDYYYLFAFNSDGTLKWKYQTDDWIDSSPAISSDGAIYVGSDDHCLYALNSDGTLKWKYKTGDSVNSSPVIGRDGTIYVGSNDGYLYAITSVGSLKWKFLTPDFWIQSSPAIGSDGAIYIGSGNGYLYAIGLDSTLPTVTATVPEIVSASQVKITGKATDNVGVVSVWVGAQKVDLGPDGTFEKVVDLYEGVNTFKIVAYDAAGNKGEITITTIYKEKKATVIILQIGNTTFTVNGSTRTLDSPPIIKNSRTLLPIRAVVESLGGTVGWDANTKKVTVSLGSKTLELWIGKSIAKVNGVDTPIDPDNSKVVPEIINSRTMLPLRFVTESLGCDVQWDGTTKTITITYQP